MFLMLHIVELYLKAGQKRLMTGGEGSFGTTFET